MANFDNIIQEINTNLPDNNTQAITAAKIRTTLIDFVNEVQSNSDGIQSILDLKAQKVSNANDGNFAGLDSNGNITDSGLKASDFATALQGAKADTAYQKPSSGIPESDLSPDVQQALQKHFKGWYNTLAELKAAHTATEGDSAYVKDASPATTWSIYVYDSTAFSDNNWADSGTDADTSNVQTFASGEEVNEVHIVNDLTTGGVDDVLSAEQGVVLGHQSIYDVSANNPTAGVNNDGKLESLSTLLSDANLNTLIPSAVRCGGMSIRFVQSSDNKYVQYRLMATAWSTNVSDWQGEDIVVQSNSDVDLAFSDEEGFSILVVKDGHLKTKEFDSKEFENQLSETEDEQETIKEKLDTIEEGAEVNDVYTTETEPEDLDISDEEGNILVQFKDGHIRTKNFDSTKVNEKQFMPYKHRTFFQHQVNTKNFLVTDFEAENINTYEEQVLYIDNCVLYLPDSYEKDGNPTKLIILCKHGNSAILPSDDDILDLNRNGMGRVFNYMLYLGYAILAADGVPDGWKEAIHIGERAVGNYVAVQSTIKAYNYVIKNYNIDANGVFVYGNSQGGHYAQNVIDNSFIPIAAAAEVSPVCSMRYHQWDLNLSETIDGVTYTKAGRLNIARIFNFPIVSSNTELLALEYDASKTVGYDPWTRNVENMFDGFEQGSNYLWKLPSNISLDDITMKKHVCCPLKIWAAEDDNWLGVDVMKVFIKAIKNSGQVADMQLFTSGAHIIQLSQSSIGTFTYKGITYDKYPIALDIASWFYNFGGYSLK